MGSEDEVGTLQAIDGTGDFKLQDLEGFSRTVHLAECGLSYAVVSIMGPQSSGKSTLLNHLFGTKFKEMDALRGRTQTTQGVWLAKAKGVEPTTLVFDLEGTDGRERGEDDTTFEKQSSLFALAVSDIVLINMWCHDIGREQAANKPLLKTVFQVMMRLFTPRRTLLLFVIRDKTRTPLSTLEPILREDIQKIWDSVPKPKGKDLKISDFFQVEVTALPNFELKEDEFHQAVIELRDRFQNSISPGGLAGDRRGAVPGTAFCLSTSGIWNVIKENKDLDLPAHKVMVATVRCEEIANEKYANLQQDEGWLELEATVKLSTMFGFGKRAGVLLSKTMDEYDVEATYFDETVREEKRKNLLVKALELLEGAFQANLKHKRLAVMDKFQAELGAESNQKSDRPILFAEAARACTAKALSDFQVLADDSFVEGSGWDVGRIRDKLKSDIDKYVMQVRTEKLGAILSSLQKRLVAAVADPVGAVLEAGGPDTWPSIRQLLAKETADIVKAFEKAVKGFELEANMEEEMKNELIDSGRQAIIKKTKEEAAQAAYRIKDRFNTIFARDKDSMPRVWTGKEDIKAITKDARTASLKLLSTLAAARLDSTTKSSKTDVIENALLHLMEAEAQAAELSPSSSGNFTNVTRSLTSVFGASDSGDNSPASVLASSSWPGVDAGSMMLSPSQCRNLWRLFKTETEYTISQALQAQELARKNNSWLPPKWAVIAMLVLGFNEMMAVVRNPFLAIFLLVFFFLAKALFVQLDIVGSFSHGFLPGMLTISTRLVPASMAAMRKLCEDVPAQIASGPQRIQSFIQSQAGAGKPEKTEKGEIAMQQFAQDSGIAQPNPNTAASDNLRQRNPYVAQE